MRAQPVPSEMLEPLLSEVIGWGIRDLKAAGGTEVAWDTFVEQVHALERLVICNRSGLRHDDPTGIHASLATASFYHKARQLREESKAVRDAFLKALKQQ